MIFRDCWKYQSLLFDRFGKSLFQREILKTCRDLGDPEKLWNRQRADFCDLLEKTVNYHYWILRTILDFNEGGEVQVHYKTVQRILHKNKIFRRSQVIRKKMVVRGMNRKKRLLWCLARRRWTVENDWKQVIFSDESQIVIGQNNQVYVWCSTNEAYRPACVSQFSGKRQLWYGVV